MQRVLRMAWLALALIPGAATAQSSTLTGASNALNPAISVNGLFLGQVSTEDSSIDANNINVQEAEARFTSEVDPFWSADVTVAMHPAHGHEEEEGGHEEGEQNEHAEEEHAGGFEVDLEEAYIDGRNLPAGFALRLGKFYLPFGKHAPLHTHQFPFVHAPVAVRSFLGDHGLTESGGLLAHRLPVPWYSDLMLYGVDGRAEIFDAGNRDLAVGGRFKNLWDLTPNATLELSGSALHGPDGGHPGSGNDLRIFGADLTYKWISPAVTKGPAVSATAELIVPDPEEGEGDPFGWYALAQVRVHRNWWLGASHGRARDVAVAAHHEEKDEDPHEEHHRLERIRESKLNITFAPSEFSALRAEVNYIDHRAADEDEVRFMIQWNFTIGAHPAHLY
ncbi:MAG: hypothetical protein GF355_11300 [Candidatus Eisenbacteria bacterium]|nr:hypothetical protein [Candidatus Eisenbacteria bacterium]